MEQRILDFIVVGAGVAGLEAAKTLLENNREFIILEAADYIGGRVKVLENWGDFPIELGGEFVHGQKTPHYDYVKRYGKTSPFKTIHYTTLKGNKLMPSKEIPTFYRKQYLKASEDHDIKNEDLDISFDERFKDAKISEKILDFFTPGLKSYNGADLDKISIYHSDLLYDNIHKDCGGYNYRLLNCSNTSILKKAYDKVWNHVKLNCIITQIDLSNDNCILKDSEGNIYECKNVICTVPITILQEKRIEFIPQLPDQIASAIEKIGMGPMGKLFVKFSRLFWPLDMGFLTLPGLFEFAWVPASNRCAKNSYVLVYHVIGSAALAASNMTKEEIKKSVLADLAKFFGEKVHSLYLDNYYMDWTNSKFIKGGYSYPTINEGKSRKQFETPIFGKLRFAGEAYREFGTTIGTAMKSGREAAKQMMDLNTSNESDQLGIQDKIIN